GERTPNILRRAITGPSRVSTSFEVYSIQPMNADFPMGWGGFHFCYIFIRRCCSGAASTKSPSRAGIDMSDVHAPISYRSTQTDEPDSVPHAVPGAPRTTGVTQAHPTGTDGNPRVSSAQACASTQLKRILVYSHDTFGLGNTKRMLDISKHLVATYTNVSVLIISGSPMVHSFRIPRHIDYIKLPCLTRTLDGFYDVKFLGLTYDETVRLRTTLITSAILDFSPDLILVDKKPFGLSD